MSTGSRMDMRGVAREKDSARAIAIHHADIRSPEREPGRIAQTHARHPRALVEEALEGLKRWGGGRCALIRRNRSAKEPGVAVPHPFPGHAPPAQVPPG